MDAAMLRRAFLRAGLFLLLAVPASTARAADTCTRIETTCLQTAAMTVGGIELEGACTSVEIRELCERETPLNECEPFNAARTTRLPLSDGQCERLSWECTRYRDGKCDRWLLKYRCWNGPLTHRPAELEDRKFHNFDERIANNCGAISSDPHCTRISDVITEGPETRTINGRDVTRSWWAKDRTFDCTDPRYEDTCAPFEDSPICTPTGQELCLSTAADGTCEYAEITYNCTESANFEAACEDVNVCIGGNCEGIAQESSSDYPKAAAWLNVLAGMAENFGCGKDGENVVDPVTGEIDLMACPTDELLMASFDPEVFSGRMMSCNRGTTDCCDFDDDGFCGQESKDLRDARIAEVTHYLDSECTSEALGWCLSVREYYCVYNSKFARVFQEQAHDQTGIQFGTPYSTEPCPPLGIDQLELLDMEAMDLSEIFGDMLEQVQVPIEGELQDRLTNGITAFQPEVSDVFQ